FGAGLSFAPKPSPKRIRNTDKNTQRLFASFAGRKTQLVEALRMGPPNILGFWARLESVTNSILLCSHFHAATWVGNARKQRKTFFAN
ncbi:MAG TPA: hypothetical protein VGF13_22785, partial [Verrucomicrobiae bacterium]